MAGQEDTPLRRETHAEKFGRSDDHIDHIDLIHVPIRKVFKIPTATVF